MISIIPEALELTKKFAAGASCKIDFENIKSTMFWPHYEAIAKEMGEITIEVVKKYWFEIHNQIVLKRFQRGNLTSEQAFNCMVRVSDDGQACVHNNVVACLITEEEAKTIRQHTPKI